MFLHFKKNVLAVAVTFALVGCGGGGGNSASSKPSITQPPVNGDTNSVSGFPQSQLPAVKEYQYDAKKFAVAEPETSTNKVKIGVVDSGVRMQPTIAHALEKVFAYAKGSNAGELTVKNLTDADIELQDLSSSYHGTLVSNVIAAQKTGEAKYQNIREGLAKDIAKIYAARTSETNGGLGNTGLALQAMLDLNKNFDVKLFNGSFGTRNFSEAYRNRLIQHATALVDSGSLVAFSTGNDGLLIPNEEALMPKYDQALEKGWLAVTGVDDTKKALYKKADGTGANACGDAARWCLAADYKVGLIYSDKTNSYVNFLGTSAAAPEITALSAMVWSKYPWMTADQVRQTILTTADYIDDGKGANHLYNSTFGWGYFNEKEALKGPALLSKIFADEFSANIDSGLAIFSNDMSGDAGLKKAGNGTLVLSGKNTYKGTTTIDAGELRVNGSITSDVNVASQGELSGTGTVGHLKNNGVVSTEKGRLTVHGDFTQSSKGTLAYGLEHYLTVKGKANLAGLLTVSAQNKNMLTEGTHHVLNAAAISGDFDTIIAKSAFLDVENGTKNATSYTVDVKFKDATKAGRLNGGLSDASGELTNRLMLKANTQVLNGQSTLLTDYVAKVQQVTTAAQAQAVLNTNAGALFAEMPAVVLRNDTMANAQVAQRAYQVTQQGLSGAWMSGSYAETSHEASGWDKVESEIRTFTVGADTAVTDQAIVGAYVTSYADQSKFSQSNGTSEADLTTFGVYGKLNLSNDFYFAANAQYGLGDVEFNRSVTNGVDSESSYAQSDLEKLGVYTELGYTHRTNQWAISPYAALSHHTVKLDGLKESSDIGVTVKNVQAKETKAHAGIRLDHQLTESMTIGGYAEYAYAFDRNVSNVNVSANIDDLVNVDYSAPSYDKDYLLYGLSFNYLSKNGKWNIFADVASNAMTADDVQAQVAVKFAF